MFDAAGSTCLIRPRLLAAAARAGAALYRRERDLPAALPGATGVRNVVVKLREAEARADEARRTGAPDYSVSRHVKLLTALLAEATLARAQTV